MKFKDQENPNFSGFDTFGSLSNDPVFDPGRLTFYPIEPQARLDKGEFFY